MTSRKKRPFNPGDVVELNLPEYRDPVLAFFGAASGNRNARPMLVEQCDYDSDRKAWRVLCVWQLETGHIEHVSVMASSLRSTGW